MKAWICLLLYSLLVCVTPFAWAQDRSTRKLYPDGSYDETSFFKAQNKIETRSYDKNEKLTRISIFNTNAEGKSLRSAVYSPEGKLRYWERFIYSDDGKTLLEKKVFKPTGELIMTMTKEKGREKAVDPTGRVMPESEWKSLR